MKYLEEYLKEKIKIQVLGELTTRPCSEGEEVGLSILIDGYEPGLEIWYSDYALWLEEKLNSKLPEEKPMCENKPDTSVSKPTDSKPKMSFNDFQSDILCALANKPSSMRKGQFVYIYIHEKYGVANAVQHFDDVDCYSNDNGIDSFIKCAYKRVIENNPDSNRLANIIK
jgi:hypothetical protein